MDVTAERNPSPSAEETSGSHAGLTTVVGAEGAVLWCVLALFPTLRALGGGPQESMRLACDAPHGAFSVGLDVLSAFFLLPVLGLSVLAAVYGGDYMLAYRCKKSLGSSWFFFNACVAGMVMVVLLGSSRTDAARHAHESSPWMLGPMALLVFLCLTVAVVPQRVAGLTSGVLNHVLVKEAGDPYLVLESSDAPLHTLGIVNAWTLLAFGAAVVGLSILLRNAARVALRGWWGRS